MFNLTTNELYSKYLHSFRHGQTTAEETVQRVITHKSPLVTVASFLEYLQTDKEEKVERIARASLPTAPEGLAKVSLTRKNYVVQGPEQERVVAQNPPNRLLDLPLELLLHVFQDVDPRGVASFLTSCRRTSELAVALIPRVPEPLSRFLSYAPENDIDAFLEKCYPQNYSTRTDLILGRNNIPLLDRIVTTFPTIQSLEVQQHIPHKYLFSVLQRLEHLKRLSLCQLDLKARLFSRGPLPDSLEEVHLDGPKVRTRHLKSICTHVKNLKTLHLQMCFVKESKKLLKLPFGVHFEHIVDFEKLLERFSLQELETIVHRHPKNAVAICALATKLLYIDRPRSATLVREALSLMPNLRPAHELMATLIDNTAGPLEQLEVLERAYRYNNDDGLALRIAYLYYNQMGDTSYWNKALYFFRQFMLSSSVNAYIATRIVSEILHLGSPTVQVDGQEAMRLLHAQYDEHQLRIAQILAEGGSGIERDRLMALQMLQQLHTKRLLGAIDFARLMNGERLQRPVTILLAVAQLFLSSGDGVERDRKRSLEILQSIEGQTCSNALYPGAPHFQWRLINGLLHLEEGDGVPSNRSQAQLHLRYVLQHLPHHIAANVAMARLFMRSGDGVERDRKQALMHLEKIQRRHPQNEACLLALAELYMESGDGIDRDEMKARALIEAVLRTTPNHPPALELKQRF